MLDTKYIKNQKFHIEEHKKLIFLESHCVFRACGQFIYIQIGDK